MLFAFLRRASIIFFVNRKYRFLVGPIERVSRKSRGLDVNGLTNWTGHSIIVICNAHMSE